MNQESRISSNQSRFLRSDSAPSSIFRWTRCRIFCVSINKAGVWTPLLSSLNRGCKQRKALERSLSRSSWWAVSSERLTWAAPLHLLSSNVYRLQSSTALCCWGFTGFTNNKRLQRVAMSDTNADEKRITLSLAYLSLQAPFHSHLLPHGLRTRTNGILPCMRLVLMFA